MPQVKDERDPLRTALANAIFSRGEIGRKLASARSAAEKLWSGVADAETRVATAKNAAEFSLDEHVDRLAAGETATLDRRVSRDAVENAEFDLAAARKALVRICSVVHEYEATQERVEERVKAAIGEIAAGAIGDVLIETERLKHELDGAYGVLRFLVHLSPAGNAAAHRASVAIPLALPGERMAGPLSHAAVEPWRAAIDALANDADAPLPWFRLAAA